MKRTWITSSAILITLVLPWTGCKTKETASGNSANSASANKTAESTPANSNQPAASDSAGNANTGTSAQAPAAPETKGPPKLLGIYESREVEDDKGVVTIISKFKTVISFREDGSYARVSQKEGKIYHSDSGQFRIEGGDKLVLTIQIAEKNMKTPALIKTHKFSLSSDGEQLKMINDKGATGIFQRISTLSKVS